MHQECQYVLWSRRPVGPAKVSKQGVEQVGGDSQHAGQELPRSPPPPSPPSSSCSVRNLQNPKPLSTKTCFLRRLSCGDSGVPRSLLVQIQSNVFKCLLRLCRTKACEGRKWLEQPISHYMEFKLQFIELNFYEDHLESTELELPLLSSQLASSCIFCAERRVPLICCTVFSKWGTEGW